MPEIKPIHTLDARDNIMLEVIRDQFSLTPEHMCWEIQGIRQLVEGALRKKQVEYEKLRSALVPSQNRREIALVFDTTQIASGWYGNEVMDRIIPLFDRKTNHSVLAGDYFGNSKNADNLFTAFAEAVAPRRPIKYRHPTQFFIVYVNNLTDAMVERLDHGLGDYIAYAGSADMTYGSRFKTYLSLMLSNSFIKHGSIIIQGHEPDRSADEDVNMKGYSFEENGYTCRSVNGDLYGVMLSYKIERQVYPGFEADTEFALNAIGLSLKSLKDFTVEVADAKLEYLKSEKSGSIARAGLERITAAALAALIQSKVEASYIYNLASLESYSITKFNVIIELPRAEGETSTRLLAALACEPENKTLRLLTLF